MVKNLHPWFHGGAWSRPCLRWWVGSKALSFSRCVFLFAPELCGTPLSKTTPRSRPSSDEPGRGGPDHHDRRRRKTGCKSFRLASGNQRKAERRQTRVYLLALRQARTLQGALACRRSTAALPLGLTHPKVRSRTRFRGVGALVAGVSRRRQPRLQRGTSHAGHSAGGHDVRYRPSATGTNPLRAGTASRSRQPESPSDVLARRARGRRFYTFWDYCQ